MPLAASRACCDEKSVNMTANTKFPKRRIRMRLSAFNRQPTTTSASAATSSRQSGERLRIARPVGVEHADEVGVGRFQAADGGAVYHGSREDDEANRSENAGAPTVRSFDPSLVRTRRP
jgi:hypothetical protein